MEKMIECIELKISLEDTKPEVWRTVVVPSTMSLKKLHIVIQMAMGWESYHLFDFEIGGVRYGEPDEYGFDTTPVKSLNSRIGKAVSGVKTFKYVYDYGDNWVHQIKVVGKSSVPASLKLPACIGGENACPPEDCGGTFAFENLKDALADKKHPDHEEIVNWIGDDYNYQEFSLEEVNSYMQELH